MRRKLLHRMKEVCGATSRMMKDELIVGEHQVDGIRLLIYRCLNFFAILVSQVDIIATCTFLASLLQCIGQNICLNYIQIVVFIYIILGSLFYFIFCVNNWLS